MFEITFLRHGESTGVQKGILQGHLDYPLTAVGQKQVHQLASFWQQEKSVFDQILTSPLLRASETARIIADELALSAPQIEPLWLERDFGKGEGVDLQMIKDWYQQTSEPTVFEARYETGESEWQIHIRAAQAVENLMQRAPGCYLVVSHGNIIHAALHLIFGLMPYGHSLPAVFALDPACYAKLQYNQETGRWHLVSFNDHSHLKINI
jgi:broad specificity phosphatase PhoE